ncbi:MAG: hypothetical protein KAQ94_00790 [Arcobacteraceae bacterium]|nr:hypothetical protein [Arcobacteraceae bacterium]
MINFKYLFLTLFILFLQGCNQESINLKKLVTTNNAIQIENNHKEISALLIEYKEKLDKRNPKSFDKVWQKAIIKNIQYQRNNVSLYGFKDNYKKYLKYAFDTKTNIKNRNDFLILGLYKLLYLSYTINDEKYTALSYKIKTLKEFSDILQIIKWQINYKKDLNKNYLFLTWQNNWQVELLGKTDIKNPDYNLIKNLTYIKNNKESVFDASNMSFETILGKVLYINNNSIKRLGGEPNELTIEFLKFFVFL